MVAEGEGDSVYITGESDAHVLHAPKCKEYIVSYSTAGGAKDFARWKKEPGPAGTFSLRFQPTKGLEKAFAAASPRYLATDATNTVYLSNEPYYWIYCQYV